MWTLPTLTASRSTPVSATKAAAASGSVGALAPATISPDAPSGNSPSSASTAMPRACASCTTSATRLRYSAGSESPGDGMTRPKPAAIASRTRASSGHSLKTTAQGTDAVAATARPNAA